jgi:hypothetical protein
MKFTTQYMTVLPERWRWPDWLTRRGPDRLNAGGSSAGRNFATDVPLNLCDAAPLPNRFASADNNKITWTCNRGGSPVIMRYSATGSSDGASTSCFSRLPIRLPTCCSSTIP